MPTAKEKIRDLGCPETRADIYIDVLRTANTPEELSQQFDERCLQCDPEQFLLPYFRPLYLRDAQFRENVNTELRGLGISDDIIEKYFTQMGNQPYLSFALDPEYEDLSGETREKFSEVARGVMLTRFKNYLSE